MPSSRPAARRHAELKDFSTHLIVVFALALALGGCAGDLENPERFTGGITVDCSTVDVEALLEQRCSGSVCHSAALPAASLDLVSTGVAVRLIDVMSTCGDRILFDSSDPGASYLTEKLLGSMPECGSTMPLGGQSISAGNIACIEEWLEAEAQ